MLAQPYLRTSTDDKGQDPQRQMDVIRAWASREGVGLLPEVVDEGTSGTKTSPFSRPRFAQALEQASRYNADAIVIESIDRMTREGIEQWYRTAIRLKDESRLAVWWADMSLAEQQGMAGEIILAVRARMAKEWADRHARAVKSGMERAKTTRGRAYGRPAKILTASELELVHRLRSRTPAAYWHVVKAEVNKGRPQREGVSDTFLRTRYTAWLAERASAGSFADEKSPTTKKVGVV